jgi:hypothetical protein
LTCTYLAKRLRELSSTKTGSYPHEFLCRTNCSACADYQPCIVHGMIQSLLFIFFSSNMVTMLSYFIVNIKHVLSPRGISREKGVHKCFCFCFVFSVTKLGLPGMYIKSWQFTLVCKGLTSVYLKTKGKHMYILNCHVVFGIIVGGRPVWACGDNISFRLSTLNEGQPKSLSG